MCQKTPRLFACAACQQPVLICPRCDRGNIYCAGGCAEQRRRDSLRRAGTHYQKTRRGAERHAARQAAFRDRHKKVTHQGSDPPPEPTIVEGNDPVPTPECSDVQTKPLVTRWREVSRSLREVLFSVCSFCHQQVSSFIRTDRLRR